MSLLLVLPLAVRGAEPGCVEGVLRELGWTLVDGDTLQVAAGDPCMRANPSEAIASGDLRAVVPRGPERGAALARLLRDPATTCAFRLRLADASRTAIDTLVANERFRFFGVQASWLAFDRDARDAWQPIAAFGRAWRPAGNNHDALAVFANRGARAECGVGRQVAQLAGFDALFGADGFEAAFERDELVLGTFVRLGESRSVLLGSGAGELARDGLARSAATRGRAALLAAPAFLHAVDRGRVVDIANQAQNGVIVAMDDDAIAALRDSGSLADANSAALHAWQLARGIERRGPRWFQRLVGEDDVRAWDIVAAGDRAAAGALRDALDHPVLSGTALYGHAHGVRPLRWWIARMLDRNPGTPYRFELANHNLDGEIRERWLAWRLAQCSGESLASERAWLTSAPDPLPAPSGPAPRTAPATAASSAAPRR
ncbi:MAG TPA: hypothetical protein VFL14_01805 [Xanthomonadales bacterium]|nr:hypothetical protein [Xanthomonadales bacterium]